ncbi:hypothetical protein CEXT_504661 [Caerostris extrusa]|uniref:Uncharacterized protein n=1 Tax=Caerostris extrusa TaxID=172846 RepID=A0AAV4W307_CAEEX|nr:hypothetical protein CEXT_504661 [Caerostris extrusa]
MARTYQQERSSDCESKHPSIRVRSRRIPNSRRKTLLCGKKASINILQLLQTVFPRSKQRRTSFWKNALRGLTGTEDRATQNGKQEEKRVLNMNGRFWCSGLPGR